MSKEFDELHGCSSVHEDIRNGFADLLNRIDRWVPNGRERALVVTKLQEAYHWALRALPPSKETP